VEAEQLRGPEAAADPLAAAAEALAAQAEALRDCRECGLCAERTQVVFGVGSPVADLLFVGEGPGFHEDRQGEPFVGQAGKLLTELLGSIGLTREQVYIANVVKCRPPGNRDPLPDEIEACSRHLMDQVRVIRPRVICTLGRFATRLLAETDANISAVRGKAKEHEVAGVPVLIFPVFHPAAALYTQANKAVLKEDFLKLRVILARGRDALAPGAAADALAQAEDESRATATPAGPPDEPRAGTATDQSAEPRAAAPADQRTASPDEPRAATSALPAVAPAVSAHEPVGGTTGCVELERSCRETPTPATPEKQLKLW
jgi:uracil-DNA glycosylase family 4